jgi:hypothetical protein
MIVVLLAFAAIVVDAGAIYSHRRQIQTAADAAALSGVQELPLDPASAEAVAANYAAINAPAAADAAVYTVSSTFVPNDTLTAELLDPAMGTFFARFMGIDERPVGARAVAIIGSPTTYGSGLMPFGVLATGTVEAPYGYEPGGVLELVCANADSEHGNWHYVDLTPFTDGAKNTKGVISVGGTTDPVSIGDYIYTQTGSVMNPNFTALSGLFEETCEPHGVESLVYDAERGIYEPIHAADGTHCNRLITVPVIIMTSGDPYDWASATGNELVQIVGFMNMLVTNNPRHPADSSLWAEFVQVVPADALDPGGYVDYAGIVYWLAE